MWDFSKPQLYSLEDSIVERFTATRDYRGRQPGKPTYDSIDLGQYLQDKAQNRRGLFLLHIRSAKPERKSQEDEEGGDAGDNQGDREDTGPIEDTRLILVTDLGFIVKQSNDGSRDVFVQSIHRGEAVSGARIEVIGRNGEPVAAATTDATGRAQFPKLPNFQREKIPLLILAQKDSDFSFMPLRGIGTQSGPLALRNRRRGKRHLRHSSSPPISSPIAASTGPAKPRISA